MSGSSRSSTEFLGPYELIRRLEDGAMGERWDARRPGSEGALTLELLHGRALAIPELRARLFDELRRAIALRHSNIVSVVELAELAGRWVLVTEAVEGLTLADFAARVRAQGQRMSYPLVAYVIGEVLRGLAHAHGQRLVHGAIRPGEIRLSSAGAIRIAGFGLARTAAELSRDPKAMRYMPPEQLTGGRGPCLDLFAIGGVLHELLDGHEFRVQATDDAQLYAAIRDGRSAPLSAQHHDYPVPLESLRTGLLAPQLEFRIPSAHDALALLGEWPGYRDASHELAELVRGFLGPRREVSATVLIDPSKLFVEPEEPTVPPRRAAVEGLPPDDEPEERTPLATIAMVAAMAMLGLGFVIVGIGFAVGWWGPRARTEPEIAEIEQTPEPDEPTPEPESLAPLPGAELTPEIAAEVASVAPKAPSGPLPGAEPTPEIEPEPRAGNARSGQAADGSSDGATASARKRVSVTFTEHQYSTLEVKVGGRVIELDGRKAVSIAPGTYVLDLREAGTEVWRSAGKVTFEAGKRYQVSLLKPPLAMVKTL